jgi:hypothetical protein
VSSPAILNLFGEGLMVNSPKITSNSPLCEGDDLYLFADSIENAKYTWYGPAGFVSTQQNVVIKRAKPENTGRYYVYASINGISTDTSSIDVLINTQLVTPGDSSFIFVGSAKKVNNFIRLTESKAWDGGSIWLKNRFSVKKDFETTFQFRFRDGHNPQMEDGSIPGADGIAFVMQNHNYPFLGEKGGAMGYKGITNSLAIEIDLWKNPYDPNGNHIAVQSLRAEGNQPDHDLPGLTLAINSKMITMMQDSIYFVKISYDWNKKNLKVFVDSNSNTATEVINLTDIDLSSYLNLEEGEYVYIGFTSGTGDSYQEHDIFNWTIPCLNQLVSVEDGRDYQASDVFSVYPNPTSDQISIQYYLPIDSDIKFSIVDILGKQLISSNYSRANSNSVSNIIFNLQDFENGIYFVIMETSNKKYFQRLVKFK